MYKIYADDTLIYDSTIEDYKIGKGSISLETNKSGSFVFSVYPEHFYYDKFVRLKTVIKVCKSNKITFRGRIINDVSDYWNNKVITCEGELGFLQDSIIRPFEFSGSPEKLFKEFINEHNSQVDDFKKFKIGTVTVIDSNDYITRSNSNYESTYSNLNSRLINDSLGGYFYITHGNYGKEDIPTLNYLADFENVASQKIEFGSNLKKYTKTVKADSIATAIIPLGHEIDEEDDSDSTTQKRLTIASVNNGVDYIYDVSAVKKYGWIFKTAKFDDVTTPSILKTKAQKYLEEVINQNITVELTAIDLHLLDSSIESFKLGDYIEVNSTPHKFNATLLCNKQTIDLLKPENDTITLGHTYSTFTETSGKISSSVSTISNIQSSVNNISNRLKTLNSTVNTAEETASEAIRNYETVNIKLDGMTGNIRVVADVATENALNIATNAENITTNAENISRNAETIETLKATLDEHTTSIEDIIARLEELETGGGTT